MGVFVTCINEKEPIKNKGARVVTTLYIYFKTSESLVRSCQISKPSKILLSMLPARQKKMQLKL